MSLLRQGKAQALTIYVGESDQWHGTAAYIAIIQYLREQGCAGATVTRSLAGYGAGAKLHTNQRWQWTSDAPVVINIIDQPERLRRFIPQLQEMVSGGLMTLHEVEVLKYTHVRVHGIPTYLPVSTIMETTITTVQPTTSVDTVIALLLDAPFRALPVIDAQNHLQGIISTGDLINADVLPMRRGLLRKALEIDEQSATVAQGDPAELSRRHALTAQDIMNRQVRAVTEDTSMHTVAQIMIETGLRRLPVTSAEGQLLGMITRADMLQVIVTSPVMHPEASTTTQTLREQASNTETSPQQRPIRDYASSAVTTINEQASLNEVVEALVQSPFKRVVVIDDQQHVRGIISDIDLLAQVQAEQRPGLLTWLASWAKGTPERVPTGILRPHVGKAHVAADVMNRDVVTVSEQSSVQQTIEQMITTHRKILPVVDVDKRLVGIVGRSDVLRILLENQEAE